mmetsp:Transcript_10424/g.29313  ORF Transcript_10424/g.29313 Transcript_10424/m.29313 type:complete len:131 (-) Transcript_10424:54-446(-)
MTTAALRTTKYVYCRIESNRIESTAIAAHCAAAQRELPTLHVLLERTLRHFGGLTCLLLGFTSLYTQESGAAEQRSNQSTGHAAAAIPSSFLHHLEILNPGGGITVCLVWQGRPTRAGAAHITVSFGPRD